MIGAGGARNSGGARTAGGAPAADDRTGGMAAGVAHPLGDAEIHFLWWFSQGSIMDPDVRRRLRRAWGMCGRHAAGYLTVEASLRHGYMHGPALLYEDLMERATATLTAGGMLRNLRIASRLQRAGPCLLCEMGYQQGREAPPSAADVVVEGRDVSYLRDFAGVCRRYWEPVVCSRCAGERGTARCREHLAEDLERGRLHDLASQRALAGHITRHLINYARSFRWEHRGTETEEDRAALIAAAGWCSGWDGLLAVCS